jgi:hypothetical protein
MEGKGRGPFTARKHSSSGVTQEGEFSPPRTANVRGREKRTIFIMIKEFHGHMYGAKREYERLYRGIQNSVKDLRDLRAI